MDDLNIHGRTRTQNEAWARHVFLAFLAIWVVSAGIAVVSFRVQWARWPPLWDAAMGLTLMSPVGLPMGFVQTLGARNVWRGVQMLLIVISYWTTVTALLLFAYHRRSKMALGLLSVIFVIAAVDWLYLARGPLGY